VRIDVWERWIAAALKNFGEAHRLTVAHPKRNSRRMGTAH